MEEKKQNLGVPVAIVIAGIAIAGAIIYSNNTTAASKLSTDHPIAESLGLDIKKFSECVENKTFADEISKQHDLGVSLGLQGTPHSIVILKDGTGYRINGAYPYNTVALTIEAALSGVSTEKIQHFLDMFQEQGITEEDINSYVQKKIIPTIEAYQNGEEVAKTEIDSASIVERKDEILSTGHLLGNENAAVTVVEFSDMECPYCPRFHSTMDQVYKEYEETGEVAWRYSSFFPFDSNPQAHPNARAQAEAVECAASVGGEDMFWAYIEKQFTANGL
ncbi:MAG: thioredoxin domain-containing protein [Candidatus Pacebacteria bacterium]|nr:thioredoxin domain-containing protein [Candidatus Paceibacterota bacterium]